MIIKSRLHSAWKGARLGGEGRGEKDTEGEREAEREHNPLGALLASLRLTIRDLRRAASQNNALCSERTDGRQWFSPADIF